MPEADTNLIKIPGSNRTIDLSYLLTGYPTYKHREGTIEFATQNEEKGTWAWLKSEIANYLHGKRMKMVLEDDTAWYYEGYFAVDDLMSEEEMSKIVIAYNVYPFKREWQLIGEDWLWDPFDFETGVIYDFTNMEVLNNQTIMLPGSVEPVIPEIIVDFPKEGSGGSTGPGGTTQPTFTEEHKTTQVTIPDFYIRSTFRCYGEANAEGYYTKWNVDPTTLVKEFAHDLGDNVVSASGTLTFDCGSPYTGGVFQVNGQRFSAGSNRSIDISISPGSKSTSVNFYLKVNGAKQKDKALHAGQMSVKNLKLTINYTIRTQSGGSTGGGGTGGTGEEVGTISYDGSTYSVVNGRNDRQLEHFRIRNEDLPLTVRMSHGDRGYITIRYRRGML